MRYLTLGEVVALHRAILAATGGAEGIRDLGGLESALAQPKATFDGTDLISLGRREGQCLGLWARDEPPLRRRKQTHRPCRDGRVS